MEHSHVIAYIMKNKNNNNNNNGFVKRLWARRYRVAEWSMYSTISQPISQFISMLWPGGWLEVKYSRNTIRITNKAAK